MDNQIYERYILSIYEYQNMTKAAKALGISQPALSSGLNTVEKKISLQIFERKRSPIVPTQEGKVYIDYLLAKQVMRAECQKKILDIQNNEDVSLTVGGPAVYAETILTDVVHEFQKEYPSCRIVLKEAALPELIELARDSRMDCFISTSGELPAGFRMERLGAEKLYLCVPGGWEINRRLEKYAVRPGEAGELFDFHLLDGMDFIFLEDNQPLQKAMKDFIEVNSLSIRSRFTVNQVMLGVRLAARGFGAMFASEYALKSMGRLEGLRIYSLPEEVSGRMLYVGYDGKNYLSKACRRFMELLPCQKEM